MKKRMLLILTLVFVMALVGCSHNDQISDSNQENVDMNMDLDIGQVSKLNIESPMGDVVLTDNAFITSITENINSLKFERVSETEKEVDYVYLLTWYDEENNQIANISITDENGQYISYDGCYYKVGEELCIDLELIDEKIVSTLASSIAPVIEIVGGHFVGRVEDSNLVPYINFSKKDVDTGIMSDYFCLGYDGFSFANVGTFELYDDKLIGEFRTETELKAKYVFYRDGDNFVYSATDSIPFDTYAFEDGLVFENKNP